MKDKLLRWSFTVPFALTFALSAWAYPKQPAKVPVHWGLDGQPDRWGSPAEALFMLPGIMLASALLTLVIELASPNDRKNSDMLGILRTSVGFMALLISASQLFNWDMTRSILIGMGGLFIPLGNLMGRTQPSTFAGVRTPWTYLSRQAWFKSQRRAAVWFTAYGILALLSAFFPQPLPVAYQGFIFTLPLLLGLGLVYLSYLDWKHDPRPEPVQL